MTIAQLDPDDIEEIFETDSMKTAVMKSNVAQKYIENVEECEKLTVEGMEWRLFGFNTIAKKGSEAELFVKINLELRQFMYATSDKPGSDEMLAHFMPQFIIASEQTGLQLVDVRAAATESIGSKKKWNRKRVKVFKQMVYELDERLRLLYITNPSIHNVITSATIEGVSENEMHIRLILALAETNKIQSDVIRRIYETKTVPEDGDKIICATE